MNNMKFHIMAMSGMILAAIVVYVYVEFSNQKVEQPVVDDGSAGRAIFIHSASFGLNCNPIIEVKRKDNLREGLPVDKLIPVPQNNVLDLLTKQCGGKVTCTIDVTPEALKDNSYPRCAKVLDVAYRCFSYDGVTTLSASQGEKLSIDCRTPQQ